MVTKDYYAILEIPPNAGPEDIKKAYRRLAMVFHPDKAGSDPYPAARFKDIREAYEVLSNPGKRRAYLEKRWYERSMGHPPGEQAALTPPFVLTQCLELNKYVYQLDVFRMDKEKLLWNIRQIINHDNIETLQSFGEMECIRQIIFSLLDTCRRLPVKYTAPLLPLLYQLAGNDQQAGQAIDAFATRSKKEDSWQKQKVWVAMLITLLIILLMYIMAS